MAKKGLGKGLGAIFGEDIIKESENEAVKAAVRRKKAQLRRKDPPKRWRRILPAD